MPRLVPELVEEAAAEMLAVARWYDAQAPELGDEFVDEVSAAIDTIANQPHSWPVWPGVEPRTPPVRRYVMLRFPFALAYQAFAETIEVVAVAHVRRRPGYWQHRSPRGRGF